MSRAGGGSITVWNAGPGRLRQPGAAGLSLSRGVCVALVLAAVCILLILPSRALGAAVHQREPGLDVTGLNHACGAVVDSKGDLYLSSAGESKVKVYDPSHNLLVSISDVNEPCGLAVTATGVLYVSEQATGEVVRFKPNKYPFEGTPTYGAREVIDASGKAKGISVDPFDSFLYVAEEDRVSVYDAGGSFFAVNEVQDVSLPKTTGGKFTLDFGGQETAQVPYAASAAEVQAALEALSSVGAGNLSVVKIQEGDWRVTFIGALGQTDVEQLACGAGTELIGGAEAHCVFAEETKGFSGHIGEGLLVEATGVAVHSDEFGRFPLPQDRYLAVADADGLLPDRLVLFGGHTAKTLKFRRDVDGSATPDGSFGFGPAGTYLAADPGNINLSTRKCVPVGPQACTLGHLYLYDAVHEVVDEFDATGDYVDQIAGEALTDAGPTAVAVDRSGGANDGTVYVTAGAGASAGARAFGPLPSPSRAILPEPFSHLLTAAKAVAVDSRGDVYAAAGTTIHIYKPKGEENTSFEVGFATPGQPTDIAVDSTGVVYVTNGKEVIYYTPSAYPPVKSTTYLRHGSPVATEAEFPQLGSVGKEITAIAVNPGPSPSKNHLFVTSRGAAREYDSAADGSGALNPSFGPPLANINRQSIAVNGATGAVAFGGNPNQISIVDSTGEETLANIDTAVSTTGTKDLNPMIAIDQSDGHVVEYSAEHAEVREYDAAGSLVSEFGVFTPPEAAGRGTRAAVDNSCEVHEPPLSESTTPTCKEFDPSNGNVYVAVDDPSPNHPPYDVNAFGPLKYGEFPTASTGVASGFSEGGVTLNGTVNPNGVEVEECVFEYIEASAYEENEAESKPLFEGGGEAACEPAAGALGAGSSPVAVKAAVTLPDPDASYRFTLRAANKFGASEGGSALFGAPQVEAASPHPISYTEATLRALVGPAGLPTEYSFEYLDRQSFEEQGGFEGAATKHSTWGNLAPGEASVPISVAITGLAPGTEYLYQLVARNEAATVTESTQTFVTQARRPTEECPNASYRFGLSANLPDCRAYELVTPAQTNGLKVIDPNGGFGNWLTPPRGEAAGERVSYFTGGTLPGFDGNGIADGYRAQRGAGDHPAEGWKSSLFSPTTAQTFSEPSLGGVASDQLYSTWAWISPPASSPGLPGGEYLSTPAGFEVLASGSLGADLHATRFYVGAAGAHVIFGSKAHLEPTAAPAGVKAIYDRAAGASSATVLSIPPAGASAQVKGEFETKDAVYAGVDEAGDSVAFEVGGTLYLHRAGETVEVAGAPNDFAGISEDGERIFYAANGNGSKPSALYACATEPGPCAGPGAHSPSEIAAAGTFAYVSPDGSHAFFSSEEAIGEEENENGEEPEAGAHNLYAWDSSGTRFIGRAVATDFAENAFEITRMNLSNWTYALEVNVEVNTEQKRSLAPARSTPDGGAFVFQSHARLTAYENDGVGEIYRYDPAAPVGQRLLCISCDLSGAAPSKDALLEDLRILGGQEPVQPSTLIGNVTDDGGRVFFQSFDRLVPEDANEAEDVYEWTADGTAGCVRTGGCLALISSGQGEGDSVLYAMSADGQDVFFATTEKLVGADVAGSPSLYDARVGGGIPEPVAPAPCQGDACQGTGSEPPVLPNPATTGAGNGNVVSETKRPCPKGKHRVKGRCKPVKHKHREHNRHKRRRVQANRGGSR
ncbi:MAG: hypothetical protein ACTHK3_04565 [Solirubrobacterales bacterium]